MRGFVQIKGFADKGAWRRFAVMLAVFMLAVFAGGACARAGDRLVLDDADGLFNAAPSAYVTEDPEGRLDYATLIARFNAGRRGEQVNASAINLGAQGVPHWIVITIENKSWSEAWMLTFGQRMEGRLGLLQDLQVYDNTSNIKYIDTISAAQNPYVTDGGATGTAMRVKLPR
jgi:hypothetical protein